MAIIQTGRSLSSLQVDDSGKTFTETLLYQLTEGENLVDVSLLIPPVHTRSSLYAGFRVRDASADMIAGPGGNGARIVVNWHFPVIMPADDDEPNPEFPPWQWPLQNYRASGVEIEETIRYLWDRNGTKKEYRSSAGTELFGSYPRGLRQVSFSYHLPNFNESIIDNYIGKVNAGPVLIAGVSYAAGTVLMKNLSASAHIVRNDDNTTRWRYYRIDVSMLVDTRTFLKDYPDLSTFFKPGGSKGPAQIWTCETNEGRFFGTLLEMQRKVEEDSEENTLQAVTEPMFLNANGGIQQLAGDGKLTVDKQTPTYVTGCPYEPIDFSGLNLPISKG